jgi:hypothetical protein
LSQEHYLMLKLKLKNYLDRNYRLQIIVHGSRLWGWKSPEIDIDEFENFPSSNEFLSEEKRLLRWLFISTVEVIEVDCSALEFCWASILMANKVRREEGIRLYNFSTSSKKGWKQIGLRTQNYMIWYRAQPGLDSLGRDDTFYAMWK